VHFEVGAAQDEPLVAFYGQLFGWGLQASSVSGYTTIDTRGGAGINGGIGRSRAGDAWSAFYVETDDVPATLDRAASLGGTIVLPATDVGGFTTIAMFSDLDGLRVGLVRTAADPNGAGPSAGAGEAVDWFEIMGSDAARTQQFYADLFGWGIDRSGLPDYAVANTGTGRGLWGGIGGGADACWAIVYAGVGDVEQTLARAVELGGSRVAAPGIVALKIAAREALYGSAEDMSMGAFRDPAGNVFGLYHKEKH
jgi:predicted enzyme related to lactoylglutathione lyase